MRVGSRLNTETCCYGFVHERAIPGALWSRKVQRPFRGTSLWIFGDPNARLLSLKVGGREELADPMNAITVAMFVRPGVDPELFLRLTELGLNTSENSELVPGVKTVQLYGARCMRNLEMSPRIVLPSIGVGGELAFTCTGNVRGVVLVGSQIT